MQGFSARGVMIARMKHNTPRVPLTDADILQSIMEELAAIAFAKPDDLRAADGRIGIDAANRNAWRAVSKVKFERSGDELEFVDVEFHDPFAARRRLIELLEAQAAGAAPASGSRPDDDLSAVPAHEAVRRIKSALGLLDPADEEAVVAQDTEKGKPRERR